MPAGVLVTVPPLAPAWTTESVAVEPTPGSRSGGWGWRNGMVLTPSQMIPRFPVVPAALQAQARPGHGAPRSQRVANLVEPARGREGLADVLRVVDDGAAYVRLVPARGVRAE